MIDDVSLMEVAAKCSTDHVLDFVHYCRALTSEIVRYFNFCFRFSAFHGLNLLLRSLRCVVVVIFIYYFFKCILVVGLFIGCTWSWGYLFGHGEANIYFTVGVSSYRSHKGWTIGYWLSNRCAWAGICVLEYLYVLYHCWNLLICRDYWLIFKHWRIFFLQVLIFFLFLFLFWLY